MGIIPLFYWGEANALFLWKNNDESQIAIEYLNKDVKNVYAILIEPRKYILGKKIDSFMFKGANYERCLMQYDSLQQCFNFASAILNSEKYDYLWVRSRSDILSKKIYLQLIFQKIAI